VTRYRLKVLVSIDHPVRDDAGARARVEGLITLLTEMFEIADLPPPICTLVCEEEKTGRNLLPPVETGTG